MAGGIIVRFVTKPPRSDAVALVDDVETALRRWITSALVVIATHQHHPRSTMLAAPICQLVDDGAVLHGRAVQQIAQNVECLRLPAPQQLPQSRQASVSRTAWHWHSERAKRRGFA